jgi:sulfatase maturation enzyme AslB (radical SAM superfamily)
VLQQEFTMTTIDRIQRHAKLSLNAVGHHKRATPRFMIVFINSICNLTCEHCFYWRNLNQRNDLTFEEFEKFSLKLGQFEQLNLSGGEAFLRKEFAEICGLFLKNNGAKRICVPSNGYFTERTQEQLRKVFESKTLAGFVCEISLDGMPEYHDRFRGNPKSFAKAMETYEMLAEMQKIEPRLSIHANTVAMSENMDECWRLTEYLRERCPAMEHNNLAIIRGDRRNPSLRGPALEQYKRLYEHVAQVWKDSEARRFGAVVGPMLQWAKVKRSRPALNMFRAPPEILWGSFMPMATSPSAKAILPLATCGKRASSKSGTRKKPMPSVLKSRPSNATVPAALCTRWGRAEGELKETTFWGP